MITQMQRDDGLALLSQKVRMMRKVGSTVDFPPVVAYVRSLVLDVNP